MPNKDTTVISLKELYDSSVNSFTDYWDVIGYTSDNKKAFQDAFITFCKECAPDHFKLCTAKATPSTLLDELLKNFLHPEYPIDFSEINDLLVKPFSSAIESITERKNKIIEKFYELMRIVTAINYLNSITIADTHLQTFDNFRLPDRNDIKIDDVGRNIASLLAAIEKPELDLPSGEKIAEIALRNYQVILEKNQAELVFLERTSVLDSNEQNPYIISCLQEKKARLAILKTEISQQQTEFKEDVKSDLITNYYPATGDIELLAEISQTIDDIEIVNKFIKDNIDSLDACKNFFSNKAFINAAIELTNKVAQDTWLAEMLECFSEQSRTDLRGRWKPLLGDILKRLTDSINPEQQTNLTTNLNKVEAMVLMDKFLVDSLAILQKSKINLEARIKTNDENIVIAKSLITIPTRNVITAQQPQKQLVRSRPTSIVTKLVAEPKLAKLIPNTIRPPVDLPLIKSNNHAKRNFVLSVLAGVATGLVGGALLGLGVLTLNPAFICVGGAIVIAAGGFMVNAQRERSKFASPILPYSPPNAQQIHTKSSTVCMKSKLVKVNDIGNSCDGSPKTPIQSHSAIPSSASKQVPSYTRHSLLHTQSILRRANTAPASATGPRRRVRFAPGIEDARERKRRQLGQNI